MQGVTGSIPVVSTTQKDHPIGWSFCVVGAFASESTRMHAAARAAQMNPLARPRRCKCRHSVCRSCGAADSQLSPPKNNHPTGWLFFCFVRADRRGRKSTLARMWREKARSGANALHQSVGTGVLDGPQREAENARKAGATYLPPFSKSFEGARGNFRTRKFPRILSYSIQSLAISTAAAASARASAFKRATSPGSIGVFVSCTAASAIPPRARSATRQGAAQCM